LRKSLILPFLRHFPKIRFGKIGSMTTLTRPVIRVTPKPYSVLYQKTRPIVIILERDTIGFREKGRRRIFRLPTESIFRWAVRTETNSQKKK
jgi:hypothetical protein